jgi:hypothetical protein
MTSQSINPRKMTAKEFNLEKKRWNKLKAENILLKLMNNKQIKYERRKSSQINEIRIGNQQFLWNTEKMTKESYNQQTYQLKHQMQFSMQCQKILK